MVQCEIETDVEGAKNFKEWVEVNNLDMKPVIVLVQVECHKNGFRALQQISR